MHRKLLLFLQFCIAVLPTISAGAIGQVRDSRSYNVEDLLALEDIGQVKFSEANGLLLFEQLGHYNSAKSFANGSWGRRATSKIMAITLPNSTVATPLFVQAPDAGYWLGAPSPDGSRIIVFRLSGDRLDVGVANLRERSVQWLSVIPDIPLQQHSPVWVDNDRLVVSTLKERRLPYAFAGETASAELRDLWAAQASGKIASADVLKSRSWGPRPSNLRNIVMVNVRRNATSLLYTGNVIDFTVAADRLALVTMVQSLPASNEMISDDSNPNRYVIRALTLRGPTRPVDVADDVMPGLLSWNDTGTDLLFAGRLATSSWKRPIIRIAHFVGESIKTTSLPIEPLVRTGFAHSHLRARWWRNDVLIEVRDGPSGGRWKRIRTDGTAASAFGPANSNLVQADSRSATFQLGKRLWNVRSADSRPRWLADSVVAPAEEPSGGSFVGSRLAMNPPGGEVPLVVAKRNFLAAAVLSTNGSLSRSIAVPARSKLLGATSSYAVVSVMDDHGAQDIILLSAKGRRVRIASLNQRLDEVALPRMVELSSNMSDGKRHSHWLLLPSSTSGAQPPPLLVVIYPGWIQDTEPSIAAERSNFIPTENQSILVGHGYAVLRISLPFSRVQGDPLQRLTDDVGGAVDAAIAKMGFDPRRVAIIGHSFGGYGVLELATRTDRYRALVAENAPADIAAVYGALNGGDRVRLEFGLPYQRSLGWAETGQGAMGGPPWRDPAGYVAASPTYFLDRIRTPLLLVGSDQDFVSMEAAERTFLSLTRLGRDATLLRYWGESHDILSPANIRDLYIHLFYFLDEHLRVQTATSSPTISKNRPNVADILSRP